MGKLVRNGIPKKIRLGGEEPITHVLNGEEYILELKKKLLEESKEVMAAQTREEVVLELADLAEVMKALMLQMGISTIEVSIVQDRKFDALQGFSDKVYLDGVVKKALAA